MPHSQRHSGARNARGRAGEVRIIGGRWRGRKLRFPALPGLRPTGDRLRETLFNWLQFEVPGARCLDLFAGSGALGLEAASREAARVTLIEVDPAAVQALRANCALLGADGVEVIDSDALAWLARPAPPAESCAIVFLDPPFAGGLLARAIPLLEASGRLAATAWIYLETAREQALPELPDNWHLHREKCAGEVCCRLFRRVGGAV